MNALATALNGGYTFLEQAQNALEACGFILRQPEGWGFFNSKPSGRSFRGPSTLQGDAHTGMKINRMKEAEDENFLFRFTFIETASEKGFVTHYRPKHPPLSPEMESVFRYLGLQQFNECPEFEFEQCHYRTLKFESRDNSVFDSNTEFAHRGFDAHAAKFSRGMQLLLSANAAVEEAGLTFLQVAKPRERTNTVIQQRTIVAPKPAANTVALVTKGAPNALPERFDVAITFAGTERELAQALAKKVREAGFAVFYDDFYPEQLWGKNLTTFFDEIFRKRARFCVMFISKEYQARKWTTHEARSAQARALEEKGNEYILPIRIDDTELEGLLPTVGYVPISTGIDKITDLLIKKLQAP